MTSKRRSGSEDKFEKLLKQRRIAYDYEKGFIHYVVRRKYLPDFYLKKYGFYVEVKGRFVAADRSKHLRIKEQHPEIDIRFLFDNPNAKLYKGSQTTYADWCDKHGFKYGRLSEGIPKDWLRPIKKKKIKGVKGGAETDAGNKN